MSSPVVTILLPARNAERTVARAVECLLEGTLREIRVLAVDDGSTDGTRAELERLAARDARVEVLDGRGRGLVAALELALARTTSPYVARMDADDEALPRRLEASVATLEEDPSLGGVGTGVEIFREDQPVSPSMRAYGEWLSGLTTPELLHRERFVESPVCHPSVCLRREAVVEAGGWRHGDFPEDYELWLRLIHRGWRLRNLPEVLLRWRDSSGRLTRTDPRYAHKRLIWVKAHYLACSREVAGRPLVVWGTGPGGLTLTRFLQAEGAQVARFIDVHPRKVGTRIHGIPVEPPESLGAPSEDTHLVAAVGVRGIRDEIRGILTALGWREGVHFTCAA
jgi:glycosyltransferase involved in cell wall biosynthesis